MASCGTGDEPSCSAYVESSAAKINPDKLPGPSGQKDYPIDCVIALIDMDCFYVQVEQRFEPEYRGKPAGVVQYMTRFKGGGLIALSYEARALGVKRSFRGDDAKAVCPDMKIFVVPELNGKADLTRYREAGAEVIQVMKKSFPVVERASIDEAYVDLTVEIKALLPKYLSGELTLTEKELGATCVVGWDSTKAWLNRTILNADSSASVAEPYSLNKLALAIGAKLINELRGEILKETEFHCSAGISTSKTLSKLACGINKPRKQTILSSDQVMGLFEKTEIKDVRFLGGKLGDQITAHLGIKYMAELCRTPKAKLLHFFEPKTANWLQNVAVGQDNEAVQPRQLPKSIGCSKNFLGKAALKTRDDVKEWMAHFCDELSQRLKKDQDDNNRTATLLTAHMTFNEKGDRRSLSRCCPLSSYESEHLAKDGYITADKCMTTLGFQNGRYTNPLISLGIVASKMKDGKEGNTRIDSFFSGAKRDTETSDDAEKEENERGGTPELFNEDNLDEVIGDVITKSAFAERDTVKNEDTAEEECEVIALTKGTQIFESAPSSKAGISGSDVDSAPLNTDVGKDIPAETAGCSAAARETDPGTWRYKAFDCPKCQRHIWAPMMEQEHNDWHLAVELSKVEEGPDPSATRKRLTLSNASKKPAKKSKTSPLTLDHFFKKKSA